MHQSPVTFRFRGKRFATTWTLDCQHASRCGPSAECRKYGTDRPVIKPVWRVQQYQVERGRLRYTIKGSGQIPTDNVPSGDDPAVDQVFFDECSGPTVAVHEGDGRRAPTDGFEADGAGTCVAVEHGGSRDTVAENGKERFA